MISQNPNTSQITSHDLTKFQFNCYLLTNKPSRDNTKVNIKTALSIERLFVDQL